MMETLRHSFTLRRLQNILSVTLSIAAGIVASGLIVSPHAITQTGSASREDDAPGWVDDPFPCFTPRPTPCLGRCSQLAGLGEDFDDVVPPILPFDWLATNALGPPPLWVTSNSGLPLPAAETPPNAAFVDDPGLVSDKRLDSLHFPVSGTSVHLMFQHNFNLEASDVDPNVGFDGGVLEMSFDGGNTFQDILAVGGSFVMRGYSRTISTDRGSPNRIWQRNLVREHGQNSDGVNKSTILSAWCMFRSWSDGVMGYQYSNTPVIHYSTTACFARDNQTHNPTRHSKVLSA